MELIWSAIGVLVGMSVWLPFIVSARLVRRGRSAWGRDRLIRLAGEAVIGRIADAANSLPDEVKVAVPDVPWDDIRAVRILVDHTDHRVDRDALWVTLATDVTHLLQRLRDWRDTGGGR